jgi:hypothetical protein
MDRRKQNFISVDGQTAKNSYGQYFSVGETVGHQDKSVGESTILKFEPEIEMNEIKVHTDKGFAHLDFLTKI